MSTLNGPDSKPPTEPVLEQLVDDVEVGLSRLGEALRLRDSVLIESQAQLLHVALAQAVDGFSRHARTASIPPALRDRLARAGGQVAAQRESLARATFALDRAIDVLMPHAASAPSVYGGGPHAGVGLYRT